VNTTRRAAMVAGIATMLAGTAADVNAETGGTDAELIRLEGEYAAAYAAWTAEDRRLERMQDAYTAAALSLPSRGGVIKTDRDYELGLCSRSRDISCPLHLRLFTDTEIDHLREKPRRRRVARPVLPSDNLPADAETLMTSAPWPEAQKRADEVVAAYDRWRADLDQLDANNGIEAQSQRTEAALRIERDLVQQLASTPAQSMAGIFAKVRALNVSAPLSDFRTDTTEPELLASLLTDLAQFAGVDVPKFRFCPEGFERYVDDNGTLWFRAV